MLDATVIRLKSDQGDYLAVNETNKKQLYFTTGMEIWVVKFPKERYRISSYSCRGNYRIVASTNTCYYSENQLFVKRSQYIRTENPLHKQSEKAKTCH